MSARLQAASPAAIASALLALAVLTLPAQAQTPDLAVTKTIVGTVAPGQPVQIIIVVSNVGTAPIAGPIAVLETLGTNPGTGTGLLFVGQWPNAPGWLISNATTLPPNPVWQWQFDHPGPIPPGGSLPPIVIDAIVDPTAQGVSNCVRAGAPNPIPFAPPLPIDKNPANDEFCVKLPVNVPIITPEPPGSGPCAQAPAGLVAWYPLDEGSGATTVVDIAQAPGSAVADDGVILPITIPFCGQTQFQYVVTNASGAPQKLYVNVWFDFNRDGDWDDPLQKCPLGPAVTGSFTEWAVQNELIVVPPGTHVFTTPPFSAANPTQGSDMWMRITLTDQPVVNADGSGSAGGYLYGETEDHLLRLSYAEICGLKFHDVNGNGGQDPGEPGLADWTFEVTDAQGSLMGYAVTDENGRFCLQVPAPGTYTVKEQVQPGWIPTTPTSAAVSVPSATTLSFGNRREEGGRCDLAIRKEVRPVPGSNQVSFVITVTNLGDIPCPGPTVVTETWSTGLSLVSVSGPGWLCLGNTCTYLLPIPAGGSVSLTLVFRVDERAPKIMENCATVTNANDANPESNRACVTWIRP